VIRKENKGNNNRLYIDTVGKGSGNGNGNGSESERVQKDIVNLRGVGKGGTNT
jgi:hypothetical protein